MYIVVPVRPDVSDIIAESVDSLTTQLAYAYLIWRFGTGVLKYITLYHARLPAGRSPFSTQIRQRLLPPAFRCSENAETHSETTERDDPHHSGHLRLHETMS